jgi:hypothetical protein
MVDVVGTGRGGEFDESLLCGVLLVTVAVNVAVDVEEVELMLKVVEGSFPVMQPESVFAEEEDEEEGAKSQWWLEWEELGERVDREGRETVESEEEAPFFLSAEPNALGD